MRQQRGDGHGEAIDHRDTFLLGGGEQRAGDHGQLEAAKLGDRFDVA